MPGRGSYGPGGKWIHDRAEHILRKNPKMPKSEAYAIATLQAHKLGKSPKGFRTSSGVRKAKRIYKKPKRHYKATASPKEKKAAITLRDLVAYYQTLSPVTKAAIGGAVAGGIAGSLTDRHSSLRGALVGSVLGGAAGRYFIPIAARLKGRLGDWARRLYSPEEVLRRRMPPVNQMLSGGYVPAPSEVAALERRLIADIYGRQIDYNNAARALLGR